MGGKNLGLIDVFRLSDHVPLSKAVQLQANDVLKIVLTATEDGKAKRPNQAFLLLRDQDTGLEATFPFSVKESGKGKVDFVRLSSPACIVLSRFQQINISVPDSKGFTDSSPAFLPTPSRNPPSRIFRHIPVVLEPRLQPRHQARRVCGQD